MIDVKEEREMEIIGECDPGFKETCDKSEEKYRQWKKNESAVLR